MKTSIRIISLALLFCLVACGSKKEEVTSLDLNMPAPPPGKEATAGASKVAIQERKIIKEGEIYFETGSVKDTKDLITKSVAEFNGYISQDNSYDYTGRLEYRITARIPADKFDALLERISKSAKKIDNKNISAKDVTEEFIDVEARIKTKRELEARYTELLKQAHSVEEILKIEKEIGTLRSEIESFEGRLNYLKDRIAFSTLTLTFYETNASNFGFGSKIGKGLQNGWDLLLWFLVGLINIWPFLLLIFGVLFMIRRYRRNKKKNIQH